MKFGLKSKLTFGKYKGDTVEEVLNNKPSYLEWAIDTIEWFELDEEAQGELEKTFYDELDDDTWTDDIYDQ